MSKREEELFNYGLLRSDAQHLANFYELLRQTAEPSPPPVFYPLQTCGYYDARVGGFSPYPVPDPE